MAELTVAECLQRAILCEAKNRRLYEDLADGFRREPTVATFFRDYAEDETFHLALLTNLRDSLDPEQNDAPAPAELTAAVASLEAQLLDDRIAHIATLADAYEVAHDIEGHELLTAFQLVASHLLPVPERDQWLSIQIDEHLDKLSTLGERYDAAARSQIRIAP